MQEVSINENVERIVGLIFSCHITEAVTDFMKLNTHSEKLKLAEFVKMALTICQISVKETCNSTC